MSQLNVLDAIALCAFFDQRGCGDDDVSLSHTDIEEAAIEAVESMSEIGDTSDVEVTVYGYAKNKNCEIHKDCGDAYCDVAEFTVTLTCVGFDAYLLTSVALAWIVPELS